MADFPLETGRLVLRRFEDRDLEPFMQYRNDPEVARYQGWSIPFSRADALEMIEDMKRAQFGRRGHWFQLAIGLKDGNTQRSDLVGDIGVMVLQEDPRQAEIGFTLARAYQGQGYGREAVSALLDVLFGELRLHRVRANCDPLNTPSGRLLERLGFRHEGRMIESLWFKGRWADEDWYAILQREWRTLKT